MEWVETTGKSLDEAKELALDRLGIGPDDAEFEVLEEPRTGLFGRVRGAARVRARVKPATVRPKQDRRNRRKSEGKGRGGRDGSSGGDNSRSNDASPSESAPSQGGGPGGNSRRSSSRRRSDGRSDAPAAASSTATTTATSDRPARAQRSSTDNTPTGGTDNEDTMSDDGYPSNDSPIDVSQVQAAAEEFTTGLLRSFGLEGSASSTVDGNEIEVRVDGQGDGLGLLIGPGGRTLLAVQDLARVAAQRRLGDHETRLRVDVAGYREKRRVALEKFAAHVAELVKESGVARSLDPMPSADRKVVHDTLSAIDGVSTRSEGEDPYRRIIVTPA